MNLSQIATILLVLYSLIAFGDGVILHMYKFKLHASPQTRFEHILHGVRAILFVFCVLLLFTWAASGWLLWLGALVALIDFGIGFWDAWVERDSRAHLGGLGRAEYLIHVAASVLHGAMTALILASHPAQTWALDAQPTLGAYLPWGEAVLTLILPGSIFIALLHFVLLHPRFASQAEDESTTSTPLAS